MSGHRKWEDIKRTAKQADPVTALATLVEFIGVPLDDPYLQKYLAAAGFAIVNRDALAVALRRRAGVRPDSQAEYSANDWLNIEAEEASAEDVAAAILAILTAGQPEGEGQ